MNSGTEKTKVDWGPFIWGSIAGIASWIAIFFDCWLFNESTSIGVIKWPVPHTTTRATSDDCIMEERSLFFFMLQKKDFL